MDSCLFCLMWILKYQNTDILLVLESLISCHATLGHALKHCIYQNALSAQTVLRPRSSLFTALHQAVRVCVLSHSHRRLTLGFCVIRDFSQGLILSQEVLAGGLQGSTSEKIHSAHKNSDWFFHPPQPFPWVLPLTSHYESPNPGYTLPSKKPEANSQSWYQLAKSPLLRHLRPLSTALPNCSLACTFYISFH